MYLFSRFIIIMRYVTLFLLFNNRQMMKYQMKTILQQIQVQNQRIKTQNVNLRRDLNAYQQLMMTQLLQIENSQVIYDTPIECLKAFIHHFKYYNQNVKIYHANNEELKHRIRHLENQFQIQKQFNQENSMNNENNHKEMMRKEVEYKQNLKKIVEENVKLKTKYSNLQKKNEEILAQSQRKQIMLDEQKRLIINALTVKKQKQIQQITESMQMMHIQQLKQYRQQTKQKDEIIKKIVKSYQKFENNQKIKLEQMKQIKAVISQIGNIQSLTHQINELKDEVFVLRKDLKQTKIKKTLFQSRITELKAQIASIKNQLEKKAEEINKINQQKQKIIKELEIQVTQNKKLEFYFQQKWHNQFQRVRKVLERTLSEKIRQNQEHYDRKKIQLGKKQLIFQKLHEQQVKMRQNLIKQKQQLNFQIKKLQQNNNQHVLTILQRQNQMNQCNKMILEYQYSSFRQKIQFSQEKAQKINILQQEIKRIKQIIQQEQKYIQNVVSGIKQQNQNQKQLIIQENQIKIEQIVTIHKEQVKKMVEKEKEMKQKYISDIAIIRKQQTQKIIQIKQKNSKQIQNIFQQLKNQRIKNKNLNGQFQIIENGYKKQISQMKLYIFYKVQELQAQTASKLKHLSVITQKSQNDDLLKQQMRQLIETKVEEISHLTSLKLYFEEEIDKKDKELTKLRAQNKRLKEYNDNFMEQINKVMLACRKQFNQLKQNRDNLVRIYRTKIFELQSIISRRPIRKKDESRIRSLLHKKQQLQCKIDQKQAQNIILKQLKYHYQRRQQAKSQAKLIHPEFKTEYRQNHPILAIKQKTRRLKKGHFNSVYNLSKDTQSQSEVDKDIKKMKRYILDKDNKQKNQERYLTEQKAYRTSSIIKVINQ